MNSFKITARRGSPGGCVTALLGLVFLVVLLVGAAASVWIAMSLRDINDTLPSSDEILSQQPSLATTVYDRNGKVITTLFQENRTWVPLQDVSPWFLKSVLAAEDSEFYEHMGLSPSAIARAVLVDITHKKAKQGGSTITQQLARNLFLSREKSITRKVKEAILAIRLERLYPKDKLLEMYVNTIYLGHGAYGIGAASHTYFGKKASDLDLSEASTIAGIIAAPEAYTPVRNPEGAKNRQTYVLRRMSELGWISQEQEDTALNKPLKLKSTKTRKLELQQAPYFVSHILFKSLLPTYGADTVYGGGLSVHTTLDLDIQKMAEKAFSKLKTEGALVALDPNTGEVLAMVGGKDFEKTKFNRAVQAYRQPGSAFKPMVYAAAIENGYRPVDHLLDAPISFPNGWAPRNYDGKYTGEITITDALIRSRNTPSVRLAQIVGVSGVIATARSMGITTQYLPEDLSIALGSTSVTPLEMVVAFSCFANGGARVEPFFIKEISSATGEILERNGPSISRGILPETALEVRSMLIQAVNVGTGRAARVNGIDTFGKTGTTNDWTDAWFVGGVPGLTAVVYVGNDNHKPIGHKADGGVIAAPVWKEFVAAAAKALGTPAKFATPSDATIEVVSICRQTGYIAAAGCKAVEIMVRGGEAPLEKCPLHGGDRTLAYNDVNKPNLLLSPNDDTAVQQRYASLQTPPPPQAEGGGEGLQEQPPIPVITPATRPEEKTAPPANPDAAPYVNDPSPAGSVEKRYQDLLKKYDIN